MKPRNILRNCCSLFLVLVSLSLTVSTLHSHNHIEWHHPKKHVDTGHCLTIDDTVCPICAYLFKADLSPEITAENHLFNYQILDDRPEDLPVKLHHTYLKGRSPPISA